MGVAVVSFYLKLRGESLLTGKTMESTRNVAGYKIRHKTMVAEAAETTGE